MTIDKAIIDLKARIDGEFCIRGVDNCEDMKLGIEALKLIQRERLLGLNPIETRLPGETGEETNREQRQFDIP